MSDNKQIDLGSTRLLELEGVLKTLLVGVYKSSKDKPTCIEYLDELKSLATTYGLETIEQISAPIRKIETATYLGSGKI